MLFVRRPLVLRADRLENMDADIVFLDRTLTRRVTGAVLTPFSRKRRTCSRTVASRSIVRVVLLFHVTPLNVHHPSEIATTMHELEQEKERLRADPDKLLLLFREMVQMCLWRAYISSRV